ncbi:MAG TPA: alpha/beta hydrolase [Burkholderiales bacterium]|nr:alpha/beta hydrolase [Burkholderiales bacterium]
MIEDRIRKFKTNNAQGISYRESGSGPALVMLHGFGASSAAWLFQLESLKGFRIVAWDAPGYGDSDALPNEKPVAKDYADALDKFVQALGLKQFVIVANSLGGLMAGAFARAYPQRVRGMLLVSPAGGHGGDQKKLAERLKQLDELGPEGLAEKRSPTLVAAKSPPVALELVRWSQRRIRPDGYRQACHCLANGRLAGDAAYFKSRVLVVCGTEDVITPQAGCKAIADAFPKGEYRSLAGIGHAAQIEDHVRINDIIEQILM